LLTEVSLDFVHVAYDQTNLILYVTLSQIFRVFLIPFYAAHVRLTTVLRLVELPSPRSHAAKPKYYIQSQDDLYQVNEWVKFVSPLGLATLVVLVGQLLATFGCVVGAVAGWPVSWVEENVLGRGQDRKVRDAVVG